MKEEITHFDSLEDYHKYQQWMTPKHPLFSVIFISKEEATKKEFHSFPVSTDFYIIEWKNIESGQVIYGRTKYDFKQGSMFFIAPSQQFYCSKINISSDSFIILFHKDFIRGLDIERKIKRYGFFEYSTNESLHLSYNENEIIHNIVHNIEMEYSTNQDEFTKDIIISQIEALLKYCDRFYKRQFINRINLNTELSEKFNGLLQSYFDEKEFVLQGPPTVTQMSDKLGITPRYLSDMLKSQTGKSAIEHIHLFLIEEAKSQLLNPEKSISDVAFDLGFTTLQYFSKLFKDKVGVSPKQYQKEHS